MRALFGLIVLAQAAWPAAPSGCVAGPATQAKLERIAEPADPRQPASQRRTNTLRVLQLALTESPDDVFLHEAYQDAFLSRIGDECGQLMEQYEALLAKHPSDPIYLYLAARAAYGWNTRQALTRLREATALAPDFAPSRLLLARVYSAEAFLQPQLVAEHLDAYGAMCPSSVRAFDELRWSKDQPLVRRTSARLRTAVQGRTDSEAVAAYPLLWSLEESLERSDNQAANRTQMAKDIEVLRSGQYARDLVWLNAIREASEQLWRPEWSNEARRQVAARYPKSAAAAELDYVERPNPKSAESVLAVARRWSGSLRFASSAFLMVSSNNEASEAQFIEVLELLQAALKNDPVGILTHPPVALEAAQSLVERGVRLELVEELVRQGLEVSSRMHVARAKSDLRANDEAASQRAFDQRQLAGYFPLLEARIRLGRLSEARQTLVQTEDIVNRIRPAAEEASDQKSRHAETEAWFWYLKGLYAAKQERKLDALVAWRNSISLYPPRRPRADRRDEVMRAARAVWKDLGGTEQGWSDWAAQSSVRNFDAGSGGKNAWALLAAAKPGLRLTDTAGTVWRPEELAGKTTFVTLWASWCGPCRAELPYVEKLAARFRDRSEIAVLALNVDDDPKDMHTALRELQVKLPAIAARDFAYEMLPSMAIPAAWLLTPARTEMFTADNDSLPKWMEQAAQAIEKAARK